MDCRKGGGGGGGGGGVGSGGREKETRRWIKVEGSEEKEERN